MIPPMAKFELVGSSKGTIQSITTSSTSLRVRSASSKRRRIPVGNVFVPLASVDDASLCSTSRGVMVQCGEPLAGAVGFQVAWSGRRRMYSRRSREVAVENRKRQVATSSLPLLPGTRRVELSTSSAARSRLGVSFRHVSVPTPPRPRTIARTFWSWLSTRSLLRSHRSSEGQ